MGLTIDLYVWSLTDTADHDRYASYLNEEETARRGRFVFPRDRDAFLVGRGRMREILAERIGATPSDVSFDYGPNGKPLTPDGPCFNLSHSGGIACLAVHPTCNLGVDIEAHRPVEGDVARRFFSDAENVALAACSAHDREAAFFRCWSRKEAFIKAVGDGLSMPLTAFDVTLDEKDARLLRVDPAFGQVSDWALVSFSIGQDIAGAVAVQSQGQAVALRVSSDLTDREVCF